ncbi:unnamed protein product [Cuscuta europaea]|uniref:Uncharacterized protein n=1 Tax=Cuscuta europaea TaxID=41803 RepID=A0A9P0Z137_CUSEU|nr:unnamed protein product [Cuscuta europaea]
MYPIIYNSSLASPSMRYIYEEDEDLLLQQISIYSLVQQQQHQQQHVADAGGEEEKYLGCIRASSAAENESNNKSKNKKDRHSKIHTAQGPRDRRMRLSLDVARKFFDLQDMLGFDKASKTVDWLLTNSKSAIRDLSNIGASKYHNPNNTSSHATSECGGEAVSGVVDQEPSFNNNINGDGKKAAAAADRKAKAARPRAAASFNSPTSKESRSKARERARERTREKKMGMTMNISASSLLAGPTTTPHAAFPDQPPPPEEHSWCLSNIFQFPQNPLATSNQPQFADLAHSGKYYWDGYNSGNL